jgi:inactivated superfamily I helicase
VRVVTFSLHGITVEQYEEHCERIAGAFMEWPGLLTKIWLSDPASNRYGGIYVFESKAAADASRATEIFAGMTNNPAFTDLSITEYSTLGAPTRITARPLHDAIMSTSPREL